MKPLMLKSLLKAMCCAAGGLLPVAAMAECIDLSPGNDRQQFQFQLPDDTLTPRIPDDAVIGKVEVRRMNVFDLDNPEENLWYGRLANRLHWVTRERVVRDIQFGPGASDPVAFWNTLRPASPSTTSRTPSSTSSPWSASAPGSSTNDSER